MNCAQNDYEKSCSRSVKRITMESFDPREYDPRDHVSKKNVPSADAVYKQLYSAGLQRLVHAYLKEHDGGTYAELAWLNQLSTLTGSISTDSWSLTDAVQHVPMKSALNAKIDSETRANPLFNDKCDKMF